jgi:hypothetical protein
MTIDDFITLIATKFDLNSNQVEFLRQFPEKWWLKCIQAIKVSEQRGYPLKIEIDGLKNNKPRPKLDIINNYEIYPVTRKYKHSKKIEIKI